MTIARLFSILPPSTNRLNELSKEDWVGVEAKLGTSLPNDYKEFIRKYGAGRIGGFLWIFNPFSTHENINLASQLKRQLNVYAELQSFGENLPYKMFPGEEGIFPFGMTDNGDVLFWKTVGSPDEWGVIVNASRSSDWQEFDKRLTEFLFELLSGELICTAFPLSFPVSPLIFEAFD